MRRKKPSLVIRDGETIRARYGAYLRARDGCVGLTTVQHPPPLFIDMPLDVRRLPENAVGRASPSITYRRYILTSTEYEESPDLLMLMYDEQRPLRPAVIDDMKPMPPLTAKQRRKLFDHFSFFIEDRAGLEQALKDIKREYRVRPKRK